MSHVCAAFAVYERGPVPPINRYQVSDCSQTETTGPLRIPTFLDPGSTADAISSSTLIGQVHPRHLRLRSSIENATQEILFQRG